MSGFEPSELERAWAVLNLPRAQEFESFPLALSFAAQPCRVALDRAGVRHLLVPALGEGVPVDRRPAVLGTTVRRLSFGGPHIDYLDVSCTEPDLFGEFDEVLRDVLQEIVRVDRPASTAVRVVARWRNLFRNLLVRELSPQAKMGLFGELTVLSELLLAERGFPVESWRGPLNEPHDFEAEGGCIEVKTLGAQSDAVTIHGLDQLDTHDGRSLDLVLLRVVDDPNGLSLNDVVVRIEESGAARDSLRSRLAAARWHPDPVRPDPDRFAVEEVLRVRVDGSVPRLVGSDIVNGRSPDGITDVRYSVELAALLPHAHGASLSEIASELVR
ncbi:PD-(D/E)XK motif protein [Paractinoplanes maris]|uniref:PD-(D/E)XK motif protein n=1 Tax=Paractinoplanes maris TaxID=1734446 RepID=UPI0020214152|nr:PD-(D/E)XK motif protein [Actinoplanes maris]